MKKPPMSPIEAKADEILVRLKEFTRRAEAIGKEYEAETLRIKNRYVIELLEARRQVKVLAEELTRLGVKHKQELFAGDERKELTHGILIYQIIQHVIRGRNITPELLESLGEADAVRIAKSVNWDAIEAWEDERLERAGIKKITKEEINYTFKKGKGVER